MDAGPLHNLDVVTRALCALERRDNSDAFVIVTHPASGKFVQFAGGVGQPLLLDLPAQALDDAEWHRAIAFFRRLGVDVSEHELLDRPGGRQVGRHVGFEAEFESVNLAARTALDVIETIFELPLDAGLEIEEN